MTFDLTTLIPNLRLRIGDIDPASYRYTDQWLEVSLQAAVETLGRWWNYKYLLDALGDAYRNPNGYFIFDENTYGVIEPADKQAIILMAAYIILEGSLENSAWNFQSWRDNEIAFSNLESSRARNQTLSRLWEELTTTLKVPQKRLARALKGSLPGYKDNPYEREDNY
jgi:hypothetical protein